MEVLMYYWIGFLISMPFINIIFGCGFVTTLILTMFWPITLAFSVVCGFVKITTSYEFVNYFVKCCDYYVAPEPKLVFKSEIPEGMEKLS